jgi:hypothetical protein
MDEPFRLRLTATEQAKSMPAGAGRGQSAANDRKVILNEECQPFLYGGVPKLLRQRQVTRILVQSWTTQQTLLTPEKYIEEETDQEEKRR